MKSAKIELLPVRPAIRQDAPVTLDVLLRIVPPWVEKPSQRPTLNLGLVLDRSGSMGGSKKMDYARQAAIYAVQQLLPEDRVSITIFDDHVETIVPSTLATNKPWLIEKIQGVHPGGSTALHAGWQEGGRQVREHLVAGGLNRVLLLTDGLANVGEVNADNICTDVKRLSVEGVSTTTMGVGRDYNEDLLEAMANSGDGNYYYIESPVQLPDMFQTELHGLMATVGHRVLLSVEPQSGVTVADVLNDLERDPEGRLILPNLVVGMPVELVLRLNVPPQTGSADLCGFRVTWQEPQSGEGFQTATLRLQAVNEADWDSLAADVEVQERVALQLAGRYKREATRCLERGNLKEGQRWLREARQLLVGLPRTALVEQEERDLDALEERLQMGDITTCAKMGKYQQYKRSRSKQ